MTELPELIAVGVGPGDPELITLKGLRAIQSADVIFTPLSREGDASIALQIATPWIDQERQRLVSLPLPMTRDAGQLRPAWQAAAATIQQELTGRQRGVYLLLGDPLLYGTFSYLWRELHTAANITVKIIPGITSFAAAAAAGGLPLTMADERLIVLPASYETDTLTLQRLLTDFSTVVLMKAGTALPTIVTALQQLNLLDHALYAERVGLEGEFITRDLRTLDLQHRPYLSLVIVRRGGWL
ncbi:precorrin-2 C(20)-methyltransferase [Chloroflexus sp. MS-CIW-1]|jgi:precorrin-2/cobalt-factor-2 C20-methyltransferase|uniref:precorrin-2 C(20)-methyltransferase n=1 Tax=Chloroflexus sp. MS-CIW-1 TaxID=3055768 RepID=UPI001AFF893C|nr:precorrin-2 C(20)-methyltransferase [Chloroflexus sp. MS-CIW-1]MBO9338782.1 precorrin-2 C(20)-methyltransferase [Chloroflexus sp.]MDN5272398.1 precorrin-2 C(20)-methyltransferase [Chloroflexus sp. MS-CIW-1]